MKTVALLPLLVALSVHAQTSASVSTPPLLAAEPKLIVTGHDGSPDIFEYSRIVPRGFHVAQGPNWGLLGTGLGVFALGYVTFALIGATSNAPVMAIPLVGPALSYQPSAGFAGNLVDFLAVVFIVADTIVQVTGASLSLVGALTHKKWLERDPGQPGISFGPGAAGGASLAGRF
jgi:hypothetical protein